MSKWFGYTDDYKIVDNNVVTLQIDGTKVSRWCDDNMMMLKTGKSKIVCFKNQIKLKMNDRYLGHSDVEKDVGVIISRNLSCSCQVERRSYLSVSIDQTEYFNHTSWLSKKQLYRSFIISYGPFLWKPSKCDLQLNDKFQHRVTA